MSNLIKRITRPIGRAVGGIALIVNTSLPYLPVSAEEAYTPPADQKGKRTSGQSQSQAEDDKEYTGAVNAFTKQLDAYVAQYPNSAGAANELKRYFVNLEEIRKERRQLEEKRGKPLEEGDIIYKSLKFRENVVLAYMKMSLFGIGGSGLASTLKQAIAQDYKAQKPSE